MANKLLRLTFGFNHKEFKELDRFFVVSMKVLGHLKPMYEKFLPVIRKELKDNFAKGGRPAWAHLKPSYLASFKKMRSKYPTKILKLTGKLWKAATRQGARGNIVSVTDSGLTWGIDLKEIPYARLHDKGGKLTGKARGRMPQREFLRLTKDGLHRIMQKAHRFIRSEMRTQKIQLK